MSDITITQRKTMKQRGEKMAMLICYDATFAYTASVKRGYGSSAIIADLSFMTDASPE
ncbi:hypothetical protein [Photorhabdus sp. SF281]|uniref:hypothetical protein n=1 Tax=Photorhabdus sp. SF281 TaxID=3459527 RepID=UPI004044A0AF